MMVREAPPTWSEGVVGTQNCRHEDSCIAMALSTSHGKRAATLVAGIGLPQPSCSAATLGPLLPHEVGPPATVAKMLCHAETVGLVPLAASTPQLSVLLELEAV